MKDIFYCTKIDKNGNTLTSSYTSKKGADKYGVGCNVEETVLRADFTDSKILSIRTKNEHFDGPVIRGILKNSNPPSGVEQGRYVIWGKQNGTWTQTVFHFPSYSAANTAMKSMIAEYEVMAILDMDGSDVEVETKPQNSASLEMSL